MWQAFFILYAIVAHYQGSQEEALEVMRHKINALIQRHNEALDKAEEMGISYDIALDTYEPYLSNLEIDILHGFKQVKYEKVEKWHLKSSL